MTTEWLTGRAIWLTGDDCPDCGGPLTQTRDHPGVLSIECPGCAYRDVWQISPDERRAE